MDKEGTKAHAIAFKKTFQKCEEDHPEFKASHLWGLSQIGVMKSFQALKKPLVKKLLQKSCVDVRFTGHDHGNLSGTALHAHVTNHMKRLSLVE